jgi:2-polyprenyl-6-methoxyphenol hydroxylase-like FAD-dependent oxidoreductase
VRALVLGAGPAGLLAARVLARHGVTVELADPEPETGQRTRPQAAHVHRWPASAWERLTREFPGLESITGPCPEREVLDEALWALCRPHLEAVHAARMTRFEFPPDRVRTWTSQGERAFDLLVDASGATRATLASLAAACGQPIPLHQGPPSGGYVTFPISDVQPVDGSDGHASRDARSGAGAVLQRGRLSTWRLTLQLPPGVAAPADLPAARAMLAAFDDPFIHGACRAARSAGASQRFGGRPPARLGLEEMADLPERWLPLGDCLLATPPYLGHGLDQLTEQVELLDEGLAAGCAWPVLREQINARARERWWAATWIEALRAPIEAWVEAPATEAR